MKSREIRRASGFRHSLENLDSWIELPKNGVPQVRLSDEVRRRILDPEAGTALAQAKDYGLDLTLILSAVERTPEERLEKAVQAQAMTRTIRDLKKGLRRG